MSCGHRDFLPQEKNIFKQGILEEMYGRGTKSFCPIISAVGIILSSGVWISFISLVFAIQHL
ncbi:hypothetical protein I7I48_05919 [Histoplasma ohiense]|nr:hypothetical protein I7I48_05919 [Histoplasma ohiense (nom. inval.)]